MGIYKKIQNGKLGRDEQLMIKESDLNDQSGTLYQKGAGYKLTVTDALENMIHLSDNTGKNILQRLLTEEEIDSVFQHIGIQNPYQESNGHIVTPRGYTRIFKSLYFSTYLKPDNSQALLELATDTQMEELIANGVPPEIQVAHKYGERPDGLADCGIVYHRINPYFLCIMTKNVLDNSTRVTHKILFSELSRIIYKYIDSR